MVGTQFYCLGFVEKLHSKRVSISAVDMRDQAPESVKKRICLKVFVSFWRGREREREKGSGYFIGERVFGFTCGLIR